jgi:hypothetical protein
VACVSCRPDLDLATNQADADPEIAYAAPYTAARKTAEKIVLQKARNG